MQMGIKHKGTGHIVPHSVPPPAKPGITPPENKATIAQKHEKYSKLDLVGKLQREGDNKK